MAGCPHIIRTCLLLLCLIFYVRGFNLDTTIPIIKRGQSNSYFGYSVAQHQEVQRTNPFQTSDVIVGHYLLVGAPNLNIPTARENYTGGVYKCNALSLHHDDCELLLQNEFGPAALPDIGKRNQWLGVSVRSGGIGGEVVACAHRYTIRANNFGIGTCYQLSQSLEYNQDLGIGNIISPCRGMSVQQEHEEYAFCQGGTSAFISKDSRLVVGAPGATNWRGMMAEIDISPTFGIKRLYKSPTIVNPPVKMYSYLGYSVSGGKFDKSNMTYFIAGAPHSEDLGQVVFFTEMQSGSDLRYEHSHILTGELPFSGFAQDVIAVDINKDGYDDLIVGAPLYYMPEKDNIRIGGAIYVYSGNNGDMITSLTKPQVIKGRSTNQEECDKLQCHHARFGFSLSKAGDLNLDGYQDIAVGAPYEGKGAVYIYHGSRDGLIEPYSQRIYAQQLPNAADWVTFGYSLSGGLDLDSNTYPDLLVGGYEVNQVALLRARPIIHLHSNITVTPDKLNMSSADQRECEIDKTHWFCVELKLCLRYTAEPAEQFEGEIDIIYTIIAEPDRINPRVEFIRGQGKSSKMEDTFVLLSQKITGTADAAKPRYSCIRETAYLKDQISDVLTPLEFGISYRLPERTTPIPTPAPGALPDINKYPILDAGLSEAKTMIMTQVEFIKKCGSNQICESDLQLDIGVDLEYTADGHAILEVGGSKKLRINVEIENRGEIAYQARFYLTKPEALDWKYAEPNTMGCDPINETMIECKDIGSEELGDPMKAGVHKYFTLVFSPIIHKAERLMQIAAWVNTTSAEQTPKNDYRTLTLVVFVNADLEVIGKSEPDSAIQYSGIVRGESAIWSEHMIGPSVNHTFQVFNNGPGVVQSSEITIRWPYELASKYPHGKHLLYLMQPPQVLDGGDAFCFDQPEIVNVADIAEDYSLNMRPWSYRPDNNPEYNVHHDNVQRRRRRETDTDASGNGAPENIESNEPRIGASRRPHNAVLLDCAKGTAKCYDIRCKIGVLNASQSIKIRLRARLWESTLIENYANVGEVHIRSMGKLHIRPELNVLQKNLTNDVDYATTVAIPSFQIAPQEEVEWWIIVIAVIGGILLLVVLALILWKCGFFKRRRFEEANPKYSVKLEKQKENPDEADHFLK